MNWQELPCLARFSCHKFSTIKTEWKKSGAITSRYVDSRSAAQYTNFLIVFRKFESLLYPFLNSVQKIWIFWKCVAQRYFLYAKSTIKLRLYKIWTKTDQVLWIHSKTFDTMWSPLRYQLESSSTWMKECYCS